MRVKTRVVEAMTDFHKFFRDSPLQIDELLPAVAYDAGPDDAGFGALGNAPRPATSTSNGSMSTTLDVVRRRTSLSSFNVMSPKKASVT